MTTLSDVTLRIAKLVMPDFVLDGKATSADHKSLTDTLNLTHAAQYFDRGTVWIRSGPHIGKMFPVTGFIANKLSFEQLSSVLSAQQVETVTVTGTIDPAGAGNATVVLTSAYLFGSPKTLSVAVANNDTAAQVATKIRTALNLDSDITDLYTIGGASAAITLTSKVARSNDTTLLITVDDGTCSGLTLATSTNTTLGIDGPYYTVARNTYPLQQIKSAIREALQETYIEGEDTSLAGDGSTHRFILPAGVSDIKRVEIEYTDTPDYQPVSTHWDPDYLNRELVFEYGFCPPSGTVIHIFYRKDHDDLVDYDDTLSDEISLDWLVHKSAEKLLWWGVSRYGKTPELRIEEHMNKVMERLKTLSPKTTAPETIIKTANLL